MLIYYYLGKEIDLLNDGFKKIWDEFSYYAKDMPDQINEDDSIGVAFYFDSKIDRYNIINKERHRVFTYNIPERFGTTMDDVLKSLIDKGLVIRRRFKSKEELEAFQTLFGGF
jgi:hypothetical protein